MAVAGQWGDEMLKKKSMRTTHRSASGKKLYAKRDAAGRFKDIQTYKRAHAADLRKKSKAEREGGAYAGGSDES